VTHDAWHIGAPGEQVPHGIIIKQIRVAILLVQNLARDALTVRAAALTFATILGAIPFLALVFFVFQTFHLDAEVYQYLSDRLESRLSHSVPSQEEEGQASQTPAATPGIDSGKELKDLLFRGVGQLDQTADGKPLENPVEVIVDWAQRGAKSQAVGVAGIIFVLGAVFGLMNNIESAFNTIWGLKRTRSWYRMFSDYLTLMLVLPFVVALVISVTAILESDRLRAELGFFGPALRGGQYAIIWLAFTAMYFFVPNTRVRFRYALLGGVVAGTLWCLLSWAYVKFQIGMLPKYNLFFSTVAQVPLLLMWVYFGWLILLFGAELTFAYQHEKTFAMERLAQGASYAYREALGLWVMVQLGKRFDEGLPPLSVVALAEQGNVPARLVADTLETLEKAGLATQCDQKSATYQPGKSLGRITVGDVIDCLREAGRDPSDLRAENTLKPLLAELFDNRSGRTAETIGELIAKMQGRTADEACTVRSAPKT